MHIPTTAETRDSIINFWETRINSLKGLPPGSVKIKRSFKSALYIMASAIAPVIRLLYLFGMWALNQTDPQTADDENEVPGGRLQQWGRLLKVGDPKPGQAPRYQIDITGTDGSTLLAGTAYRSNTGNIYLLEAEITIVAGVAQGIIKASVSEDRENTEFALSVGSEVNTVNPFAGIDNPALVSAILTVATDGEGIETSYRPRVVSFLRLAPQGGARIDYKRWPLDAEGVAASYPYSDQVEPGKINVYIEATPDVDPDGIPTQAVLDAAFEAILIDPETGLQRKPMSDFILMLPITVLLFDMEVIGLNAPDIPAAQASITSALTAALKAKKPFLDGADFLDEKNDTISRAELLAVAVAAISRQGGTIDDLVLELTGSPIDVYVLDNGEKSKAGNIIYS